MYNYAEERKNLFTDEGQRKLLKMRDAACIDRLVELGEIIEVGSKNTWGQFRLFTKPYCD